MAERPYVDGPPGPLAGVVAAAMRAAAHWSLPEPDVVRVGMNGIFDAGGVVLRVGRVTAPASSAIELAALLGDAGVRVPAPARPDTFAADELTVTAWERLEIVEAEPDWRAIGAM